MRLPSAVLLVALFAFAAPPAHADVPLSGTFVAQAACPAEQSFNRHTNPGTVMLTPGQRYDLVSANAQPASHFLVVVPGASPERRWVAVACGTPAGATATTIAPAAPTPAAPAPTPKRAAGPTHFVLALSWQPGFCAGAPHKTECATQAPGRFDATNFTLHGLWPDPRQYCGVAERDIAADKAGRWDRLPRVDLTPATAAALGRAMPGTQSQLERHEWIKHGTCAGATADAYFARALEFVAAVNASPVQGLFKQNIGRPLQLETIRAAFDRSFGRGAGQRIRLSCDRGGFGGDRRITELTIGLEGDVMGGGDLNSLIAAAAPTNGGCDRGTVTQVR